MWTGITIKFVESSQETEEQHHMTQCIQRRHVFLIYFLHHSILNSRENDDTLWFRLCSCVQVYKWEVAKRGNVFESYQSCQLSWNRPANEVVKQKWRDQNKGVSLFCSSVMSINRSHRKQKQQQWCSSPSYRHECVFAMRSTEGQCWGDWNCCTAVNYLVHQDVGHFREGVDGHLGAAGHGGCRWTQQTRI